MGTLKGKVGRTKSAYTTEMKNEVPADGCTAFLVLPGADWFTTWREVGVRCGKPRGEATPMLPYPSKGGWTKTPLGAGEGADWLRQLPAGVGYTAWKRLGTSEHIRSRPQHSAGWPSLGPQSVSGNIWDIICRVPTRWPLLYSRDASAGTGLGSLRNALLVSGRRPLSLMPRDLGTFQCRGVDSSLKLNRPFLGLAPLKLTR